MRPIPKEAGWRGWNWSSFTPRGPEQVHCAVFWRSSYGAALRTEYNAQPPQHRFEPGEIRYWIDWVSRMIPNSGHAFATNFLVQPQDVGYTIRPVRFITLVREPIPRIAGEFVAFRREIEARGGADAETREIASDIVHFADALMRNNYLVRFFSSVDICDPIEEKQVDRARAALARLDVVGRREIRNYSLGVCFRLMCSHVSAIPTRVRPSLQRCLRDFEGTAKNWHHNWTLKRASNLRSGTLMTLHCIAGSRAN